MFQRSGNEITDQVHLRFFHAARGHGRRADAHAASDKRRARVERHGVAIDGNARFIQSLLRYLARELGFTQIDQHQMIVGAVRREAKSGAHQCLGQRLGVLDDLLLVDFEFRA